MFFRKKTYQDFTDESLVHQFSQSGDPDIVGVLYQRYAHLVFGVCLKYLRNRDDSRDAVIAIFERLLTNLKDHKIENFKSWLHSVSRNHCLMILRKLNRPGTEKDIETLEHYLASDETENTESIELSIVQLEKAITRLNADQRVCIELFYIQEKSYQEVAAQTGFSLISVKSHIQNGKRNLKNMLQSHEKPNQ